MGLDQALEKKAARSTIRLEEAGVEETFSQAQQEAMDADGFVLRPVTQDADVATAGPPERDARDRWQAPGQGARCARPPRFLWWAQAAGVRVAHRAHEHSTIRTKYRAGLNSVVEQMGQIGRKQGGDQAAAVWTAGQDCQGRQGAAGAAGRRRQRGAGRPCSPT